jgi:hypothetical protein
VSYLSSRTEYSSNSSCFHTTRFRVQSFKSLDQEEEEKEER